MQINNITSGLADAASLGKRADQTASNLGKQSKPLESSLSTSPTSQKAMAEIMKKYDVKNITPEQFSSMIQQLYDKGAITKQEYQELSAIRTDLEKAGIGSNESINLIEFYSKKIVNAQQDQEGESTNLSKQQSAILSSRLDWAEKFSAVHENPDAIGMNLVA
jgi:hypothetical protein